MAEESRGTDPQGVGDFGAVSSDGGRFLNDFLAPLPVAGGASDDTDGGTSVGGGGVESQPESMTQINGNDTIPTNMEWRRDGLNRLPSWFSLARRLGRPMFETGKRPCLVRDKSTWPINPVRVELQSDEPNRLAQGPMMDARSGRNSLRLRP